jgi:hypothetical protein
MACKRGSRQSCGESVSEYLLISMDASLSRLKKLEKERLQEAAGENLDKESSKKKKSSKSSK